MARRIAHGDGGAVKARGKILWVALVVSTIGAPEAHAFVRETTGYTSGTPLAWSSRCVVIAVPIHALRR